MSTKYPNFVKKLAEKKEFKDTYPHKKEEN